MGLRRQIPFEDYVKKDAQKVTSIMGVLDLLIKFAVWVGKESDHILKYMSVAPSPDTGARTTVVPVSSGTLIVATSPASTASLVAGSTSQRVNYSRPILGSYILNWRCYNANGDSVGVTILPGNQDSGGFTVTYCDSDCTIAYTTSGVL